MITYKDLEKFGLGEKRAKVYLASLELGPATAAAVNAAFEGGHGAALILTQKFLGAKPFPKRKAS